MLRQSHTWLGSFSVVSLLSLMTWMLSSRQWQVSCESPTFAPTVVGIDFGSEYVKISYVAPMEDDPLPIMLNDMSERKTLNLVAFRNGNTLLGPHAVPRLVSTPEQAHPWLNNFLGRAFDDPLVQERLPHTSAHYERDAQRGTVLARMPDAQLVPVEYLSAIFLENMMQQVESYSKRLAKDVVITVPPYFGQAQRQAILDAAKMADINVLALLTDLAAAGLFYGTVGSRSKEPHTVVIFDSGSTHTSAALISVDPTHQQPQDPKSTLPLIQVKAIVSDAAFGGLAIDRIMLELLVNKFASQNPKKTIPLGKTMNRVLAEANRVKKILSANTEIIASIEDLFPDLNFNARVTRKELEQACAHLLHRPSALLDQLLKEAGIGKETISVLIPIGGNSRVPFVLADLREWMGGERGVAMSLNTDETIAQGAAWYAASLKRTFRLKPFVLQDAYTYPIDLHFQNPAESANTDIQQQHLPIYPIYSPTNGHKSVALRNMDALHGTIVAGTQGNLFNLLVSGMSEAVEGYAKEHKVLSSKLKFRVHLDRSGMIKVEKAVAAIEYEAQQPKKSDGAKTPDETNASSKDADGSKSVNVTPPDESASSANQASNATDNKDQSDQSSAQPVNVEMETVQKTAAVPLNSEIKELYSAMAADSIASFAAKIREARLAEQARLRLQAARNALESNIYRMRAWMGETIFKEFANPQDLKELEELLKKSSGHIEQPTETQSSEIETYAGLTASLQALEKRINVRQEEHKKRPNAISDFKGTLVQVENYVATLRKNKPDPSARAQTDQDLEHLWDLAEKGKAWLVEQETLQAAQPLNVDPLLKCDQIGERNLDLVRIYDRIRLKELPPPPPPPPPSPSPSTSTSTSTGPKMEDEIPGEEKEKLEL